MMYQSNPPLSPKETLPTMYDLPSEDPEEPGGSDEFHLLQPELLRLTFRPPSYPSDQVFTASDLNLYYDVHHTQWYKRPDWFAVLGVSRLYEEKDLRLSYVTWQEGANPFVVVELLSPGTEKEDLGQTPLTSPLIGRNERVQPPNKWTVYEQILRIPYYFVFNRYTNEFRAFELQGSRYQRVLIEEQGVWLEEAQLGLGLWEGEYQGISRLWLRWYDQNQNWILTPTEQEAQRAEQATQQAQQEAQRAEQATQQAQQEAQRAERATQRAERLAEQLRALGIDPEA
nr:Uma2 family endonuclease [Halothece sp. PCC 7418]